MKNFSPQIYLPLIVAMLIGLSLVMVYSSSAMVSTVNYHDGFYYFKRQLLFVCLGGCAFFAGFKIPPELLRAWAYPIYFAAIMLLCLVLVPGLGKSAGGAVRWIALGPFRLQAGEIFKFALVVYLAMSLAEKSDKMHHFRHGLLPHLIFLSVGMGLLIIEPDFGTTVLVAMVTMILLFVGGARIAYLFAGLFFLIPVVITLISSSPYRMQRVMAFLDPWSHRQDIGYQVVQSLLALGAGGPFGMGLGQGRSKLFFLPAAHTDFILASIGEELGFIGVTFVVACFAAIVVAGWQIVKKQNDLFYGYLALGLTTTLVLQAVINVFVVLGLFPTKGITLPFVSYGGSSLLCSCLMVGILLNLARYPKNEEQT